MGSTLEAEVEAVRMGVHMLSRRAFTSIVVKTDSKQLVDPLKFQIDAKILNYAYFH
jgi:ribonuclease HI